MSAVDETTGKFASRPVTSSDLLQWAIINKSTEKEDAPIRTEELAPREPIDPKWVDVILGKSDSVRMKECMDELLDDSKDLDIKLQAFDELEMLVESIDNANDLRNLGLWTPLFNILKTNQESEMRSYAAWVLGTAVQNNPTAQSDFLTMNGLPVVLDALKNDQDSEVRAKCVTCLSGLVRHNLKAYELLATESNTASEKSQLGLDAVVAILKSTNGNWVKAQKRAVFFLSGLISGSSGESQEIVEKAANDAIREDWAGVTIALLERGERIDIDLLEKSFSLLNSLAVIPSAVSVESKKKLKTLVPKLLSKYGTSSSNDNQELDEAIVNTIKDLFL
ncbi:hsp70 nucleotide exchange factor fes1 [Physocladia obscura]|uniref:Hsp70 nucleotide exchange factor fes1 n=1 Tax=Physocladia obscura TaxID=109957 RepID=A0AAD5T9T4_9FUNG|nr:hsp70 nucleotide exchange factor fes1 [Physocladia obscura]